MAEIEHGDPRWASDEHLRSLLAELEPHLSPRANAWAVAEALVDGEVAAGEYPGCSSELEMAFVEYERRALGLLGEVG